ncbi:LOW QUALITY PROTEIN: hypothetical protein U0070_023479, partial [Myodes glareolus]
FLFTLILSTESIAEKLGIAFVGLANIMGCVKERKISSKSCFDNISGTSASLVFEYFSHRHVHIWVDGHGANMSYSVISNNSGRFSWLILFTNTVFTLIPFIMTLITFLLLIFFPWTHFNKTQLTAKGSRNVRSSSHKDPENGGQLVIVYHFLSIALLNVFNIKRKYNNFAFTSSGICFSFSPFMCTDSREQMLRQAFLSMLWGLKDSGIMNILLETMNGVLHYILLTTLSVEFLMGNLGNAFTVLVNIMDWLKWRKISFIDQILTTLAISRIALLFSLTLGIFISEQYPDIIITRRIMRQICIFWTVTNHFSIWLATCLSIFYFLKIASFSNSIFLQLKWRVKKIVSGTLLASLFLLFLNILVINTHIELWIDRIEASAFFRVISSNYSQVYRHIILTNTVFTLIPFTVTLTMFLLLIFSLWRHLKSMQYNAKGSRDVSKAVHIKALQMVVSFLLLYSIFFLSLLLRFFNINYEPKKSVTLLFCITEVAFPSGHSYILILGNTKLRQAFVSMMWWLSRKLMKCIHGTGEHHGLDQEKKYLFGGSDPQCSGHFQIHSALVINCMFIGFFQLCNFNDIWKSDENYQISWTVTNHLSIWFATFLSIFYFLKIANFSSYIFLYPKWRVEKVILVTLLIDGLEANVSYGAITVNLTEFSRLVLLVNTMFTLTPFTVSLTLFLLLIFSLWRHLKNMQHNAKGSRDVSTTAHIKALHLVVIFLPFMCPEPSDQEAESILTFYAVLDEVQTQRNKM